MNRIAAVLCVLTLAACTQPAFKEAVDATPSPTLSPAIPAAEEGVDLTAGTCCAQAWPGTSDGVTHQTKLTGYYPDPSKLEGGFNNRYSEPLATTQAFLAGKVKRVSVAMDSGLGKVKRKLCSPELNAAYHAVLSLLVEDTGSAFNAKGWKRADICTASKKEAYTAPVNGTVTLIECK